MFKRSLVFAALAAAAMLAQAQQSYQLTNQGRIHDAVSAYASVNGQGSSLSHAEGAQQAIANGRVGATPGSVVLSGDLSGFSRATAYNVATGSGVGTAGAGGWSDASLQGYATSKLPTGEVTIRATADGGMVDAVRNGSDATVLATTRQDGFADGTYRAGFAADGKITQVGGAITGIVQDTSYAHGEAVAGGVTFSGGTPPGQAAAVRYGNAGAVVNVDGSFIDPAGQ
ncbi:MAG: hypothetical protein EOO54_03755 [Haliea sp.]|nr:MAG: hypothetical protein EOO54_03755 [Haliea sp.]